jgi:manganese-dependent inorganic pyrophosphatase
MSQTIEGINDCEILEIIDHHKLGDINTSKPIYVKHEPLGSSCTIIAKQFFSQNVLIPKKIKLLLIAGIISDTTILTSPTTTFEDVEILKKLKKNLKINLENFGKEIFNANLKLVFKDEYTIIRNDLKDFVINGNKIGISQVQLIDVKEILKRKEKILKEIEYFKNESKYHTFILMITDIFKKKSYLILSTNSNEILKKIPKIKDNYEMNFISRKKELFPFLNEILAND